MEHDSPPRDLTPEEVQHIYGRHTARDEGALRHFREYLVGYKHQSVEEVNILFVGLRGAGKTCLINAVHSGFAPDVVAPLRAQEGLNRVTTDLRASRINSQLQDYPVFNSRIVLWDAPGVEENTATYYRGGQMTSIIAGQVYDGQKDVADTPLADMRLRPNPTINHRMHAIIVCIPAALLAGDIKRSVEAELSNLMTQIASLRNQELQPLVVITQVDKEDERLKLHPELILSSGIVERLRTRAQELTGINKTWIMASQAYVDTIATNTAQSAQLLWMLVRAVQKADNHLRHTLQVYDNKRRIQGVTHEERQVMKPKDGRGNGMLVLFLVAVIVGIVAVLMGAALNDGLPYKSK